MTEGRDAAVGLTSEEVEARRRQGRTNRTTDSGSRSVAHILRANILTRFNAIISVLLVIVLAAGDPPDALFGMVMVVNAVIGIVQELRAKRTLDRLTLLSAPRATVVRDGESTEIPTEEIVVDDALIIRRGDQIAVDGEVTSADGLHVDESLLTGESDPVEKLPGDRLLSGSFVASGSGGAVATAVGEEAYARKLAAEAKRFTLVRSELRAGIDRLLQIITWLLVPVGALVLTGELLDDQPIRDALVGMVAAVVGMIPQGLVLLVSLSFAVAVIRLGRRKALVQELPAVEVLARVDTICLDKTGTLTEGSIDLEGIEPLADTDDGLARRALAALAAADPYPNPTLAAIARGVGEESDWNVARFLPFSSARKTSGAAFDGHGAWMLGAPEVLLDAETPAWKRATELAAEGKRVVLLARVDELPGEDDEGLDAEPVALAVLGEAVRRDAADTIAYFLDQKVRPKVISGDSPHTVGAIARRVGVPDADDPVDARTLADDTDEGRLGQRLDDSGVFGRVSPEQKRAMVRALQTREHTVAMTGDGVNDVLALKDADMGIAMGSGTSAARSVAQLVLLDDRFASLPGVVAEGRRVIANMERVAKLFLTKTAYATALAVLVGIAGLPFPFLPRHLTLIGSLTIGIPAFILSFEPSKDPARTGFVARVLSFAVPAGAGAAAATFAVYALARSEIADSSLADARSAATITLTCLGLWILGLATRPLNALRGALITVLAAAFVLAFAIPLSADFFALTVPPVDTWGTIAAGVGVGIVLIEVLVRLVRHHDPFGPATRAGQWLARR
ncbi:MAG: HAD-IC family P-type ATPase [Miltoncostaeaceae bacterium]